MLRRSGSTIPRWLAGFVFLWSVPGPVCLASDHDDGELDLKGRNLNITDVYVFREDWETTNAADSSNLVVVMNVNPRSLPGFNYFFSTQARYQMHFTRVANKSTRPTGKENVVLRFEFDTPDTTTNTQTFRVTSIVDGAQSVATTTTGGQPLRTTAYKDSRVGAVTNNSLTLNNRILTVFAGSREDPFFFDVEQYFQVRAFLAGLAGSVANSPSGFGNVFRAAGDAIDFTKGYNVLSIVVRVPINFLQANNETVFDVWETISVPN